MFQFCVCVCVCISWIVVAHYNSTNMEDLREKTHTQHYEVYRQKRLQEMGFTDMSADNRPIRYRQLLQMGGC